MKTIKNMMLLSLVIALGACSNEENVMPEVKGQITIEAGFGLSSRVATDGLTSTFESGDAIGVYAWTGGTTLPSSASGFVVNNVVNTFDGSQWSATPKMLWKDDTAPHYFLGVYPQTDILATTTYTLDPANQEQSDLLVATNFGANNEGIKAQANPVSLAFGHVMAKLRVNIKFNDEFTTASVVSGVTAEAKNTATIDWPTATATAMGTAIGVQLPALAEAASGYAYSYESVMVPQTGFKSVAMVIDGQTYTFISNEDIPLSKGTVTTLNLTVGRTSAEVGSITINEWVEGGAVVGSLENISLKLKELEENFAKRIQSLTFIPQYSDGKILMDYSIREARAHFRISPAEIAEVITTDNVKAFARYTDDPTTRASYKPEIPLTIRSVSGDNTGMLEVKITESRENQLSNNFWLGNVDAIIYIQITDKNGNNVVSDAIPMIAHNYAYNSNDINGFGNDDNDNGQYNVRE